MPPRRFVDRFRLSVQGGKGGNGSVAMQSKGAYKKTPWGGHGGRGGDVKIVARSTTKNLNLSAVRKEAGPGGNGGAQNKRGRVGRDLVVHVPLGTQVIRASTRQNPVYESFVLGDLEKEGDELIVAEGGRAGFGNANQATKSHRFYDRLTPERAQGKEGASAYIELVLKLIADVGLVGMPNAGKSTLLGALSASRPKTAPYPFTTVDPFVGHVHYSDTEVVTVADVPGLVQGASMDRGMGHEFLRHVERTKVLAIVVDCSRNSSTKTPNDAEDEEHTIEERERDNLSRFRPETPSKELQVVIDEVDAYQKDLLQTRPVVVIANKFDSRTDDPDQDRALLKSLRKVCEANDINVYSVLSISALFGKGIGEVARDFRLAVESTHAA